MTVAAGADVCRRVENMAFVFTSTTANPLAQLNIPLPTYRRNKAANCAHYFCFYAARNKSMFFLLLLKIRKMQITCCR